uniref:Uncharacterized protein n=1 Tax=Plectus sambesii TaxID=2011161 RepID=A0A914UYW2_9BILA
MRRLIPGTPCAVCGDLASGIHYSVASCNGCKTFFRRVVADNRIYACKNSGNCPVNKDMRCSCRHCRFKKCLDVGMDRTELNIEHGRKRSKKSLPDEFGTKTDSPPSIDPRKPSTAGTSDARLESLIHLEYKYMELMTSDKVPIYSCIDEALASSDTIFHDDVIRKKEVAPTDPTRSTFWYWRGKTLSIFIDWAKTFNIFQCLSYTDKVSLIIHSGCSHLVFSEAFHTPEPYTDRIVFPDGMSANRNRPAKKLVGLVPTFVAVIDNILVPLRKMQLTQSEYVLLQAVILLDPECPSLSESGREMIAAERRMIVSSLRSHCWATWSDPLEAAHRYGALLLRIVSINKVAAIKRESMRTVELFNILTPHPLTMEISKRYSDISNCEYPSTLSCFPWMLETEDY